VTAGRASTLVATLAAAAPAVSVLVLALPHGRIARAFAGRLRAVGGGGLYRWSLVGGALPRGLRLRVDGRVTGIPRRAGTFRLRVRAIDRAGSTGVRTVTLRIVA